MFAIGLILVSLGAFVFHIKLYYPTFSIENITNKEVMEKLDDSNEKIVNLSDESIKTDL